MFLTVVSAVLISLAPQSQELNPSVGTLSDAGTSPYVLLEQLRKEASEDAIIAALVPVLRTDVRFQGHDARVRGFAMLLQLGIKPDDKRRYTNTDQIQLLFDELQREEASSIQVEIIQALQCVQVDQRPAFMELLPGKLKKPQYSLVKASLSALFQLGDAKALGLVETRALLVAPAKANPGMIEELRQDAPDEWPELVAKLRGDAAMARIALGALADDVALYPELDEEGQAAAARGVLMLLGCGCRAAPVDAKVNDQVKAVTFAIDFYATPERVSEMPNEAISWLARLAVPPTDPLLRAKAIDGLKKVLEVHPDPAIRNQIRTGLERIGSLPDRSQP